MAHTHKLLALIGLATIVGSLLSLAHNTFAQGLGIKVQPTAIDERLDPGAGASGEITVTNEEGGTQTYYIGTRNITSMDEGGKPVFSDLDNDDPYAAASWITPGLSSITLDVGESAQVPYSIAIPRDASPGSHFAALFVTREPDLVTESGAGVGFQVATLVHFRVSGEAEESLAVREFYTDQSVYNEASITFTTRIENTGTVYERPQGIITINNMLGTEVEIPGSLRINKTGGGILPKTERLYTVSWNAEEFSIGRYSAQLSVVYGETRRFTISDRVVTFWILPLKEIVLFVGGVLGFVLLVALMLRAYVRRALRRAGVQQFTEEERERIETLPRRLARVLLWFTALIALLFIAMLVYYG